jgi:hypothetical protein
MVRYMPPDALAHLPRGLIVGAGYAWAGLMALTAGLNLYFAFYTSAAAWAAFLAIFPMASKLTAFGVHYVTFRAIAMRHARAGTTFAQASA